MASFAGCYLGHGLLPRMLPEPWPFSCLLPGPWPPPLMLPGSWPLISVLSVDGLFTFCCVGGLIHLCVSECWWMLKFSLRVLAFFPSLLPGSWILLLSVCICVTTSYQSATWIAAFRRGHAQSLCFCHLAYGPFFTCLSLCFGLFILSTVWVLASSFCLKSGFWPLHPICSLGFGLFILSASLGFGLFIPSAVVVVASSSCLQSATWVEASSSYLQSGFWPLHPVCSLLPWLWPLHPVCSLLPGL
jgi:hypothetical protein